MIVFYYIKNKKRKVFSNWKADRKKFRDGDIVNTLRSALKSNSWLEVRCKTFSEKVVLSCLSLK